MARLSGFRVFLVALFWSSLAVGSADAQRKKTAKDTRSSTAGFAKRTASSVPKINRDFAAVGYLRCGSYVGTASLVGDQRTIVTAAHTFRYSARELRRQICKQKRATSYRHFSCKGRLKPGLEADAEIGFEIGVDRWRRDIYLRSGKKRRRAAPCRFTIWQPRKRSGKGLRLRTYLVDPKTVSFPDPLRSDDVLELLRKDWAIARLTRPVDGVTPFLIPSRTHEEIGSKQLIQLVEDGAWESVGADVLAVSVKFLRRGRALKRFERCNVNSAIRNRHRSGSLFFSNCFAEPGTSGSLVLQKVAPGDGLSKYAAGGYVARGVIATVSRLPSPNSQRKAVGLTGGIMMERALADRLREVIAKANPVIPPPVRRPTREAGAG